MHPEHVLLDAPYGRSRIHQWRAHRRLVERATANDREPRQGLRYWLGDTVIATGRRIQGASPSLPETAALPDPIPAPRPAR